VFRAKLVSMALLSLVTGQTARGQMYCGQWVGADYPVERDNHAMAYDAARGVTVMFGGYEGSSDYLNETWEWDGTGWALRATGGPSARAQFAMAYDPRGFTVLFGGGYWDGSQYCYLGDTWEWDGNTWTQRATSGPRPRLGHALAYHGADSVTVLNGGQYAHSDSSHYDCRDTQEWDGERWTERFPELSRLLEFHALAYDARRGMTVRFGGEFMGTARKWTAEWNGAEWTEPNVTEPGARYWHAMAYDWARQETVLFGGYNGASPFGDTWAWDGNAWVQRASSGPCARDSVAMAYQGNEEEGVVVLFGGYDYGAYGRLADTWEWNGTSWIQWTAPPLPPGRWRHAAAYDEVRNVLTIHGGSAGTTFFSDTWEWDGRTWTQHNTDGPSARDRHAMAFFDDPNDPSASRAVLFGGWHYGFLNDTWEWDGNTWELKQPNGSSPSARYDHALAFDAARSEIVLFGGTDASGNLGDTWTWDGSTWQQESPDDSPAPCSWFAMAYDSLRGVVVLAGCDGTWEWNGNTWLLRDPNGPLGSAMAYDPERHVAVLYDAPDANTWEWDGSVWTQRGSMYSGAYNGYGARMVYWPMGHSVLLHGGKAGSYDYYFATASLWSPDCKNPIIVLQPIGQVATVDDTVEFSINTGNPPGAPPFSYRWRCDGAPLQDGSTEWGSTIAGSGTKILTITGTRMPDAGVYDAVVTNECGSATSWPATLEMQPCRDWYLGEPSAPIPTARYSPGIAYDSQQGLAVLHSGRNAAWQYLPDTWQFDGQAWTHVSDAGPKRVAHAMAYFDDPNDPNASRTVLFGGYNGSYDTNETWEWDGSNWTKCEPNSPVPPASESATMALDSDRHVLVLFEASSDQVWEWNGDTWARQLDGPDQGRASLAYDAHRHVMILHGASPPETWERDSGTLTWSLRASGPSLPQFPGNMVYDTDRHVAILHGIQTWGGSQTWEWDGQNWTLEATTGPGYSGAAMTYHATGHKALLFGGQSGTTYSDQTWWYDGAVGQPAIDTEPTSQAAYVGQEAAFSIAASGPEPLSYQWRKNQTDLDPNDPRFSGVNADTLMIDPVESSDGGDYDAVVTNACAEVTSEPATLTVLTHCIADLNCDGQIDFGDINPFVIYLSNYSAWLATFPGCNPLNGDIDGDGTYGQGALTDINPFVALFASGQPPYPCP
jgi:hypothetical protein